MIERGMINTIIVNSVILKGSWPEPTLLTDGKVEDETAPGHLFKLKSKC